MPGSRLDVAHVRRVLAEVLEERKAQHAKFGDQTELRDFGAPYPRSEFRELLADARWSVKRGTEYGTLSFEDILAEEVLEVLTERDPEKLRVELLQVAAVAVQWAEAIDRRGGR